jgi:hypothetical protein
VVGENCDADNGHHGDASPIHADHELAPVDSVDEYPTGESDE